MRIQAGVALILTCLEMGCSRVGETSNGTPVVASTSEFALDAALTNVCTQPLQLNMAGRLGDDTLSVLTVSTPMPEAVFEGVSVRRTTLLHEVRINGGLVETNFADQFCSIRPYVFRGESKKGDRDGQNYLVIQSTVQLPVMAKVGDQGAFYAGDYFTDSSKSVSSGSEVATFRVEPDTAQTAFVCIDSTMRTPNNVINRSISTCYKVSPDGEILGARGDYSEHDATGRLLHTLRLH